MRKTRLLCGILAACIVLVSALPANALAPVDIYMQGQAYERLFQDFFMPATCGIVLERQRCSLDFQTLAPIRRPHPTDAAMKQWLEKGDVTLQPKEWYRIYVPDQEWSSNPTTSWWYTAGLLSVAESLPRTSAMRSYTDGIGEALLQHESIAPQQFRGFTSVGALQTSLNSSIPVAPYPQVTFGSGFAADAQLGIYLSTLQELVDNTFSLSRPDSRAFGLAVLQQLKVANARFGRKITIGSVAKILSGDIPTDPDSINQTLRIPLERMGADMSWPQAQRNAFLLGTLIAQVAYNAAVLKDADTDRNFRRTIASLPPYGGISSDTASAIKAVALPKPGDWAAINASASAATLAIVAEHSSP